MKSTVAKKLYGEGLYSLLVKTLDMAINFAVSKHGAYVECEDGYVVFWSPKAGVTPAEVAQMIQEAIDSKTQE